jgi:hypothetical protein
MSGSSRSSAVIALGERRPAALLGLDLRAAGQRELDRVLERGDADAVAVELGEHRVQRGRRAVAGRRGDDDQPARPLQRGPQLAQGRLREAQLLEVVGHALAVLQAQHQRLAGGGRHGRDAHGDLSLLHAEPADRSVLRRASLGDVEPGHQLEAGDHRARSAAGSSVSGCSTPSMR